MTTQAPETPQAAAAYVNFNSCTIAGRMTKDPELRATPLGTLMCSVPIAVNRSVRLADGTYRDETLYLIAEVQGSAAERWAKDCHTGSSILVQGRLKQCNCTDKTGRPRTQIKLMVDYYQYLTQSERAPQ